MSGRRAPSRLAILLAPLLDSDGVAFGIPIPHALALLRSRRLWP